MQREDRVYCNSCGRMMQKQGNMYIEEFVHIKKDWGYFSDKDGITQEADICEECLEKWMRTFRIPVESLERKEL